MFQGSVKCVSRKFQRCFKEDFRVFHKVSSVSLIGNIDNLSFFYFLNPVGDMSEISGE